MTIVDTTKFAIGIVFALLGLGLLVLSRDRRGFGQRKQAGALFVVGAAVFVSIGLGWLEL